MREPPKISRRAALASVSAGATLMAASSQASGPINAVDDEARIDAIVADFMRAFGTPGIGIAIVRPARPVFLRGYGVRTLGQAAAVDAHSQFAIASNSKAFLTACLAMLVDEQKLGWDDPVVRRLPEFRMSDPCITGMMTVRDLLVHRSGLPQGAGDLLQFPITDHTAEDILRALPYFKPTRGFRAGYAYDNCLYIVAGILLQRVSGKSWAEFVTERIFGPLGMADAAAVPSQARTENHVGRHARLGPPVIGIGRLEVVSPEETDVIGPAGGIQLSIAGAVPWLQAQLAKGALPDGRRLWSETQAAEMWRPQTIVSSGPGPTPEAPQQAVMSGYALGWGVTDYRGQRMLSHGGGLVGQITRTALLPERGIGLVVYSNAGDEAPVSGLRYALLDHLLAVAPYDWVAATRKSIAAQQAEVAKAVGTGDLKAPPGGPSLPLSAYVGRYRDPWYGDMLIARNGDQLTVDFTHTPAFKSRLEPFGVDAFRTRFPRGVGEDAVITFAVKDGAVRGVTLRPLSPIADFSFDYQDLAFVPVASATNAGER